MKNILGSYYATLLLITFFLSSAAQADFIIGNLDGNDATQSADINDQRVKAMGFTMPNMSFTLDNVILRLNLEGLNVTPSVEIYSANGSTLDESLVTLENPTFDSTGIANYEFTTSESFTLEANTSYWLLVSGAAFEDTWDWSANDPGILPTGLATHNGALFSLSGIPGLSPSEILNSYEINGSVVPEASTTFAFVALLIGQSARRRRKS